MRIRSHLLLLTAVILVPGFLAASIAVEKVRDGEREAALRGLREAVRASALLVDGQVQRSLGALTALGNSPNLQAGNFAALYKEAAALDLPPDVWTLVLDETGTQVLNTKVPFGTPPPPPVAKDRVAQVLRTGQPLVTDVITGPVAKKLLTTIYLPAQPTPAGRFVVAQAFAVDHWKKTALQSAGHPDWVVGVIDRNGKFISRSHNAAELLGQPARPELVAAAAASSEGLIRHQTLENVEAYDAFVHSSLTGWTIAVAAPVQALEASVTQAIAWLVGGVVVALAAALLAGSLLSRRLIRAIDMASDSARQLGSDQPPTKVQTSLDELNALGNALEDVGHLLQTEKHAREQVEAERARLLAEAQAARIAAEAENAAKDKFLALLGHELRNPLAAISGAAEVMAARDRARLTPPGKGQAGAFLPDRFLAIIQRQNRHLAHIVDDLLDVSRMVSGRIVLDAHPLDLAQSARHCVDALRATEEAQGFKLRVETDEAWVLADAVRIEQIINNLVMNALKFSPRGGEVMVRVELHRGNATLRVSDEGDGIPPEMLRQVFEPFVQGPAPTHRPAGGLGIGLALVRQLVQLHGGEVWASNRGTGAGATFEVTLPLIAAPGQALQATDGAPSGKSRVLLVEDNPDARETVAELLRTAGYEVAEAADGESALRAVKARTPDVVVMDIGLPGMSGHEIAREFRQMPLLRSARMIALSGYGQARDKAESVAAGFDTHLVKPVDPSVLIDAIEDHG